MQGLIHYVLFFINTGDLLATSFSSAPTCPAYVGTFMNFCMTAAYACYFFRCFLCEISQAQKVNIYQ